MTFDQLGLFLIMGGVFALLLWGRIRYDVVAFGALIVALIIGVIPSSQAFSGFGHPATVIIALVLIASRGLSNSGAIELPGKTCRGFHPQPGVTHQYYGRCWRDYV